MIDDQAQPEDLLELFLKLLDACSEHLSYPEADYQPKDVWDMLAAEGNCELISRMQRIEKKELGFEWLVITQKGFSNDDLTHNAVIQWALDNNVRLINNHAEATQLHDALHPRAHDWTWLRRALKDQKEVLS